jgi:hypothetical protein
MILPSQKLHRFNPLFGGFGHPIGIICLYRGKIIQPFYLNHLRDHFLKLALDYFTMMCNVTESLNFFKRCFKKNLLLFQGYFDPLRKLLGFVPVSRTPCAPPWRDQF